MKDFIICRNDSNETNDVMSIHTKIRDVSRKDAKTRRRKELLCAEV